MSGSWIDWDARRRQAERQKRRVDLFIRIGIGVLIALVVALGIGACEGYLSSTREVTVRVNKTGQTCSGTGKHLSCTNLVYTSGGTFKNSDSLLAGKFNSSDVTGELCPGGTYKLQVRGYRQGFLNMWPNIIKVEQVVTPPPPTLGCANN